MNNKFDELAKGMAQSVTRRQALKKFSFGLAGMALACFGLANIAQAKKCVQSGGACAPGPGGTECCKDYICGSVNPFAYGPYICIPNQSKNHIQEKETV